jgi:hypothetical protein
MPTFRNTAVDPSQISGAFDSIAAAFKPPSASEILAGAKVAETRQKVQQIADLYARGLAKTPEEQQLLDQQASIAGIYNPSASLTAVDRNNATTRSTNAADNARALQVARETQTGETTRSLLAPVGEGATRFVPPSIASAYGIPGQQVGALKASEGQIVRAPDGTTLAGPEKPLSTDQQNAKTISGLGPEALRQSAMGSLPIEQIIDATTGKPKYVTRADAVGQSPVPDTTKAQVGNYKLPGGGTGSARLDPNTGSWVDTQTGQPLPTGINIFGATLQGGKDETGLGAAGANSVTQKLLDMKALGTTLDAYERLVTADPNAIGIVGTVRGAVQDVGATLQEGSKLLTPLQQQFEKDMASGIVSPEVQQKYRALMPADGKYNDRIPQAQMLQLLLASQYAKFLDPNGRISNDRLEQVQNSLGHGSMLSNGQRTKATLSQMREQLRAQQEYLTQSNPDAAKALGLTVGGAGAPAAPAATPAPAAAPGTRRKFSADGTLQ